jgi:aldehyde dehydrogenase (NAD+)
LLKAVSPANGKVITAVAGGSSKDVDLAVNAAKKVRIFLVSQWALPTFSQAYKTTWGLKFPGQTRGLLLNKLADLMEQNTDILAALETLNVGQSFVEHLDGIHLQTRGVSIQVKFLVWPRRLTSRRR